MSVQYLKRDQVQIASPANLSGGAILAQPFGPAVFHGMNDAATGQPIALNYEGMYRLATASATVFAAGEPVMWNPATSLAIRADAPAAGAVFVGHAVAASGSGQTTVDVLVAPGAAVYANLTTAVTHTASSTETVVGTAVIPASAIHVGGQFRIAAGWVCGGVNGTDTFTFRLRLGSVSGTVIHANAALTMANGNPSAAKVDGVIRTAGATGVVASSAVGVHVAVSNGTTVVASPIDLTGGLTIVATAQHSSTNAGNISRLEVFRVEYQ